MEERGNPAGPRQAPWERRRRRDRASPMRGEVLMCYGQPQASIYIGEKGAAPPLGFPTPRGVASPRWQRGGDQGGRGEGGAPIWALRPIWTRVSPLPLSLAPCPPCGGRTSPPRGWSPPTLGPHNLLGQVAPLGGPPEPLQWSRYNTGNPPNYSDDRMMTSHI